MKKENFCKNDRILYRVDPKRLSIKRLNVTITRQEATTTYENFSFEKDGNKMNLLHMIPPFEYEGIFYFGTKEEALDFIKLQIGM